MPPHQVMERAAPDGAPPAGGLRLSGIVHEVFRDRTQPLIAWDLGTDELAAGFTKAYAITTDLPEFSRRTGTGFIAMSEALLGKLTLAVPELDSVMLAYAAPDLFHSDVAGFYLSQRLPGAPVPWSVAQAGPAAVFTALRIADARYRLGELRHGALFAYDQNAAAEEPADAPDAATLLLLGGTGDVVVRELQEIRTHSGAGRTPSAALAAALDRHPAGPVLVGAALAAVVTDEAPTRPGQTIGTVSGSTDIWAAVARCWPIVEPVLIADYAPADETFHACVLAPGTQP